MLPDAGSIDEHCCSMPGPLPGITPAPAGRLARLLAAAARTCRPGVVLRPIVNAEAPLPLVQPAQFQQYLERSDIDLLKDGVGYRQVVLNLTDEELMEMAAALNATLGRFLAYESRPGRKRRMLATVLFPLDDYHDPS